MTENILSINVNHLYVHVNLAERYDRLNAISNY